MTNESISGFLNSIAEAKRAFDAEPNYQQRIRILELDCEAQRETVASRELRIHELKQNEETLTAKLRSVEAERDDAGFRALEEADKVQNLLTVVRGFINDGLKVLSAVEGVEQTMIAQSVLKATHDELEKVRWDNAQLESELNGLKADMAKAQEQFNRPFASATQSSQGEGTDPSSETEKWRGSGNTEWQFPNNGNLMERQSEADPSPASVSDPIPQGLGQSETNPTAPNPATSTSQSETANVSGAGNMPVAASPSEGQSEGPFAATDTTQSTSASSHSATITDAVPSNASPPDWKQDQAETSRIAPERNRDRSTFFKGRKYYDVAYLVPLHQWLNEGGSRDDYYWRPAEANVPLPEASQASHRS